MNLAKNLQELLVKQVTGFVQATAEFCSGEVNALRVEADLYKVLAINFAAKQKLAEDLARFAEKKNNQGNKNKRK